MGLLKNIRRLGLLMLDMRSANREKGKLHREMEALLHAVTDLSQYQESISSRMLKKMQWYMVEMVWMSQKFAALHQKKLLEEAKVAIAFSGALGGISDILIDDLGEKDLTSIQDFLLNPSKQTPASPLEQLYLIFFEHFEANLPIASKVLVLDYYWKTLEAQFASRQQFNSDLARPQLIKILKDKCGFTTLLCRSIIDQALSAQETTAIYELGGLVQFINDINDLHKDSTQKILNFANSLDTIDAIRHSLITQVSDCFEQLRKLPLGRKQMSDFLFIFHSFVIITLAQLNHYEFICGGNYQLDRFLNLPLHKTKVQPYLRRNFQYSIPKILNYHFYYPYKSTFLDEGV